MTLADMSKMADAVASDPLQAQKILLTLHAVYAAGLEAARKQAVIEADDCADPAEKQRCLNIATACLHMRMAEQP